MKKYKNGMIKLSRSEMSDIIDRHVYEERIKALKALKIGVEGEDNRCENGDCISREMTRFCDAPFWHMVNKILENRSSRTYIKNNF